MDAEAADTGQAGHHWLGTQLSAVEEVVNSPSRLT